jgi:GT2 family glycosyltransferase
MTISIIIVNYNTWQCLKNCLKSIKDKVTGIDYEIIVVDNDSQDGSREMLRENFLDVTLICSENRGFGAANNRGVQVAQGRNILFLNPDTLLINNAVKIMSDYLDAHSEVGACGGNLYQADGTTPVNSCWNFYSDVTGAFNLITATFALRTLHPKTHKYNRSKCPLRVAWVSGANLMVRKSVLDQTGGFDEDFFMYCEDMELCYRIHQVGFLIMSLPDAKIIHLEGQSSKGNLIKHPPYGIISKNIFLQKRYPRRWQQRLCKMLFLWGYFNMMLVTRINGRKSLSQSYQYNMKKLFEGMWK